MNIRQITFIILLAILATNVSKLSAQSLPVDEAGAIKYLTAKGVDIKTSTEGSAVRLMS